MVHFIQVIYRQSSYHKALRYYSTTRTDWWNWKFA